MFDSFDDASRRVVSRACDVAEQSNSDCIGTEHLLLGLMQEESGIAADILRSHGVTLEKVRAEFERLRAQGPTALTFKHIAFTPRAKHVLDFALEEADRSGEQDLGTEHILLGLLREGEGMAARILVNLGADSDELRKEVREARSLDGSKSDTGQSGRAWPPVSDRLTDRALRVMRLADKEAPFGQAIGTEHILLGLVEEWGCVAAKILKNCDVDPHSLRTEINKRISHGPSKGTMGHRTFTSRAERVVQFAQDEARVLGHEYIGTEHLLLGLLREGEGTAAQVLVSLGLDLDDIRAMVLEVVKAGGPRSLGPGPAPSRN